MDLFKAREVGMELGTILNVMFQEYKSKNIKVTADIIMAVCENVTDVTIALEKKKILSMQDAENYNNQFGYETAEKFTYDKVAEAVSDIWVDPEVYFKSMEGLIQVSGNQGQDLEGEYNSLKTLLTRREAVVENLVAKAEETSLNFALMKGSLVSAWREEFNDAKDFADYNHELLKKDLLYKALNKSFENNKQNSGVITFVETMESAMLVNGGKGAHSCFRKTALEGVAEAIFR